MSIKDLAYRVLLPYDKMPFLRRLPPDFAVLDVGCGNNSPYAIKSVFPRCVYTGLDIGDYNQTTPNLADHYIVTTPEGFAGEIAKFRDCFDVVLSTHNLEHCNDPHAVVACMAGAARVGGYVYLRFPSEISVSLPSRGGTLNFYDDPTHAQAPPRYDEVVAGLVANGCDVVFGRRFYRPAFNLLRGWWNERRSRREDRILPGTWAYHRFETLILARKVRAGGER
jgi:SAM-dependent methyltransferase